MAERNTGARVYLTVIGLMLALAGGVFTWLMGRSYLRASSIDHWPVVPCVILESGMEQRQVDPGRPVEVSFQVLYSYEWDGQEYKSNRYRLRGSSWSSRETEVSMLMDKYPAGSVQDCHVNRADPGLAVLAGESKAPGYSLWFPVIFLVGGLGVVVGAWRR
ncbi:DUF3592 domain-containing protein [Haloferula chungangensis]|uniref:DUF3592 domain-containing protein n=1 Tax=Haloferula chungangensis TaxID=1048331 RepID=A0ABW2L3U2_9BACT